MTMLTAPAHKNTDHPAGQVRTLGDYVLNVEHQERRQVEPVASDASETLRNLVIAIDNRDSARRRLSPVEGIDIAPAETHYEGAVLRYEIALAAARSQMKSAL